MERLLPPLKYTHAPSPEEGGELAQEILEKVPAKLGGLAISRLIVVQEGWGLRYRETFRRETTIQSLLIPLLRGGFSVVLNEGRLPSQQPHRDQQQAFLISHEIAHSFFYTRPEGQPPRRIAGTFASPEEEMFCDRFGEVFRERT